MATEALADGYCGGKKLSYDEACLRVNSSQPISIYSQVSECFECELMPLADVNGTKDIIIGTVYPTHFLIDVFPDTCSEYFHFSQHGVYGLSVDRNDTEMCRIFPISPADDVYKPIWILLYVALIMLISFVLVLSIGKANNFLQCLRPHSAFRELHNDLGESVESSSMGGGGRLVSSGSSPTEQTPPHMGLPLGLGSGSHRVKAIDTFRGLAVVMMIFVNAGGGRYSIFQHSPWNGLTVADIIFPWFIWIMGFSMVISVKGQIRLERRRKQLLMAAVRRTCTLLMLGIVLNSITTDDLSQLRLPGVLQRIALTYIILAFLQICFVTPEYVAVGNSCVDKLSDILSCWIQWVVILVLVGIHTYLSLWLPYQDCPAGYLGPGGIVKFGGNCTGGYAGYVDRMVFGPDHMYKHPTPQQLYHTTVAVDPEGLLGVLTSCLTGFLGVQAGQILLSFYNPKKRFSRWFIWAVITGVVGGSLCKFGQNSGPIPVNKNLWSLSYALVSSSTAFLLLLILYILVDHWMLWSGAPFIQTGRNSILLYFCSCLMGNLFPFSWKPLFDDTTHSEYLYMNTSSTVLWVFIAFVLARYKLYVTV